MSDSATASQLDGWRRGADNAYIYLITFFVLGVLAQVFLAGVGAFGDHASKIEKASSFDPHRTWGDILQIFAVVLLILAVIARESRRTWVTTLVLLVLVAGVQGPLAGGGEHSKWVGGLHALDGMIILGLSGWLTGMAHRRRKARRTVAA